MGSSAIKFIFFYAALFFIILGGMFVQAENEFAIQTRPEEYYEELAYTTQQVEKVEVNKTTEKRFSNSTLLVASVSVITLALANLAFLAYKKELDQESTL